MVERLTDAQYEPIRHALFDCTPGQSYEKAKLRIAEEFEKAGLVLIPKAELETWKRRAEQARDRLHEVVAEHTHAAYIEDLREETSAVHRPH